MTMEDGAEGKAQCFMDAKSADPCIGFARGNISSPTTRRDLLVLLVARSVNPPFRNQSWLEFKRDYWFFLVAQLQIQITSG